MPKSAGKRFYLQDLTSKLVNLVNQAKSHVLKDSAAEKKGGPWPQQLATMMRWHHGKKLVLIEGELRTSFPIFFASRDNMLNAQPRIVHQFEISIQNK